MALVRCADCEREVSDRASACPNCGAPIDAETAVVAPAEVALEGEFIVATSRQLMGLAKVAIERVGYRVDNTDSEAGTISFTTGMTMGSWSGVSGTISWVEQSMYRWELSGRGKQNVRGGQVVAMNLFDEANQKAQKVIAEMKRVAGGADPKTVPAGGCLVIGLLATSALLLGAFPVTSFAQSDPPDYVWYMGEAEALAILGTSVASCKYAGVIIDDKAAIAAMDRLVVAGVKDGIEHETALRFLDQAFKSESRDMEFLASQVDKDDPESVSEFAKFWADRCFDLAEDPRYAAIIEVEDLEAQRTAQ